MVNFVENVCSNERKYIPLHQLISLSFYLHKMKQKIFDALKTKFEGVKDEILDRIAAKAAKTVTTEDELATYIEGVTIQTIIDAYGDSRATDATKTAVINYEKKHKIKDGKPVEEPAQQQQQQAQQQEGDEAPAWAKALMADIAQLKGEKTANTRKAKFDEVFKDVPESVKSVYEGSLAAMQHADDETFDTWLEGMKPAVESLTNDLRAKGATMHPPKGGGAVQQKGEVNPALKAQVEAQKAAPVQTGNTATILGLPTA